MSRMQWYALQVLSGQEQNVRSRVLHQLERHQAESAVREVLVPTTTVTEMRGDQRVQREQRLMPGYILVQANWDSAGSVLLGVRGIRGFIGQGNRPSPMTPEELEPLLGHSSRAVTLSRAPVEVGDEVRIVDGPLSDFTGKVVEVDASGQQATVEVQIFGRVTPTQVSWRHLARER